ncbi:hypothetical protein CUMW_078590 [Citrus unshiu]|uniref:Protein SDA1 n=1 Tax=Citrus unshiu TaxID=55188 RepID=A0A2H5NV11_CITUN|nr:hypothetical protein CUMW_078590 [Citrus unshiu]
MFNHHAITALSPEPLSASGRSSEKLSLPLLQSKMKCDPDGYEAELTLVYKQFNAALDLFQQQAALNFSSISGIGSDPNVAKDLGDRAMFLAHVMPFYRKQLAEFPSQLAEFLKSSAPTLPSGLRCHVTQALILLVNRQIVDIQATLAVFMELQTLGDRNLRKLAFSHVIHSIKRMNQKNKNEPKNRALQNIMFSILQAEDETRARRALTTLCELHRRKVWFDERTANAICKACFHSSSRIMIAALSFLLDYEKIEDDDDSDASSDEDDLTTHNPQVILSKEAVYKAQHKGTTSSKKKKKAKLQRAMRSMKKQQRLSSEKSSLTYYSPLNHLIDPQGFAEKLFSRLQTCNERFEVKMMILKVIARIIGLHRLILLNFYSFLQKYVQPHQRDITNLLAAAVQACHDMVPPDAVEPLFKQIVNQFVHDRSRTEAIAVGLNVVREICLRMPLLMTDDLLQDLVLYKKSHEKAVSAAARSLITLFRELIAADTSLRALKRLAEAKIGFVSSDSSDGILSNEDFQRIKELKAKKEAKIALAQQGFKVPSSDQLSIKRVDPVKLEAHVRQKLSKEERLALIRAGREDRGKYMARAAIKQKKTGGLSNRQKEHKKAMPLAAKRAKVAKTRQEKKKKQQRAGKQFRGRKAWK